MARTTRRIAASTPGAEPICTLTKQAAALRKVRPDEFFGRAEYRATDDGFEARLPASDETWRLANTFIEEEAECCPFFSTELSDEGDTIVVRLTCSA